MIFGINTTRDISKLSQITYNNFEISLVVFLPNITTNHAITYTNTKKNLTISNGTGPGFWSFFCAGVLYISGPVNSDASLLMKHYKRMEEKLPETFERAASVRK